MTIRHTLSMTTLLLLLVASAVAQGEIPDGKIKIGVLQDLPEPYSSAAGNGGIVAAQLAASDFEKEYLKGDAEILASASSGGIDADLDQVRDWLDEEHVAAVLSSASADVNRRIAKLVEARHRTLLVAEAAGGSAAGLCSPSAVVWGADDAARMRAMAHVLAGQNKSRWYLVAEQNLAGVASETALRDATATVGGHVVGTTQSVVGGLAFGDTIAAIDNANADVVVLGESDGDLVAALRDLQLAQLKHPASVAALYAQIPDIDAVGPAAADGLIVAAPFYWDLDEQTRRFARRWQDPMHGRHVTENAAEIYAATLSFLHAAKAVDDVDARKVGAELRRAPIKNTLFGTASVRDNGQVVYDLGVYRVKAPDQVQQRWAYYTKVANVPGAQAFRPASCISNDANKGAAETLVSGPHQQATSAQHQAGHLP